MDIISMQLANKVLKKLNTEYNGVMHMAIATPGQTVFTLPKEYSVGQNVLSVYVDGALAYVNEDYVETNTNTITFNKPLESSEMVLFKTNVAGTTKYVTLNPAYDDTAVKQLIADNAALIDVTDGKVEQNTTDLTALTGRVSTAEDKIANILTVLDDDADGEIIDILANLKSQWESADGDLQTIIADKIGSDAFNALNSEIVDARGTYLSLKEMIQSLVDRIVINETDISELESDATTAQNDIVDITTDITNISNALTSLSGNIETISNKITAMDSDLADIKKKMAEPVPNYISLIDTVTGWSYKVELTNGELKANLIKTLASALISRAGTGNIYAGDIIYFNVSSKYQDGSDATLDTSFVYSVNDETKAAIDALSGQLTALTNGDVTVKVTATIGSVSVEGGTVITIMVNKVEKVQTAKANLTLGDVSAVIDNITLPTAFMDCAVTWASSDPGTVSTTGEVIRPSGLAGNKDVVLTATISYEDASDMKAFTATVMAMPLTDSEKVGIAKANLTLGDTSAVTNNVVLPSVQDEAAITWTSNNEAVIAIDGTVTRPVNGSGNIDVTLTAAITVGSAIDTKDFIITVLENEI